jgi:nickel/cobalt exporter
VLHAAGPGHGKVIIASYVLANGETVRRGIAIAFMAAALQAFMALALVAGFAVLAGPWSQVPNSVVLGLEGLSWIAVSLIGLAILWTNLVSRRMQIVATEQCPCCNQHMPAPHRLTGAWSIRRALPIAFAVGVRPCTGAIVLLVYAIAQGQLLAGGLGVAAMAFGTALTVSLLATLAVSCREWSIAYWSSKSTSLLFGHMKPIAAAILVLAGVAGLSSTISTLA